MRLTRLFCLIGAASAAMALIGASTAAASEDTALCKVHEDPCKSINLVSALHMTAGTTVLKTNFLTVLCLSSLAFADVEKPYVAKAPSPLGVSVLELTWEKCGSNAAHDNCTVTNLKLPLIDLLKTALNLGTASVLGAETLVVCPGVLSCVYGGAKIEGFSVEGALHKTAGNGLLIAFELSLPKVKGILCPVESKLTALYEPGVHVYIVSAKDESPTYDTALCKTHEIRVKNLTFQNRLISWQEPRN